MEDFVRMRNPGLLTQINFCSDFFYGEELIDSAPVYLLAGTLENLPDDNVREMLRQVSSVMAPTSTMVIVDSVLLEPGDEESMAAQRESRCRDMTIRQLHNSGARTLPEWSDLITSVEDGDLYLEDSKSVPGSILRTMVVKPF